jgi:starch-binding outer membrane protein, SusD/RagB family
MMIVEKLRGAAAALICLALIGCGDILEVDDPDVIKPDQLSDSAAIPTLVAGAVFDFAMAFNGDFNNGLVPAQGLFTDEYIHSETFPDRLEIDRRAIDRADNQMAGFAFNGLHVARVSAGAAAALIEEHDPTNANLSTMYTLAGFTEVFLGETFCSGVPVSSLDGNEIVFGEPRTTTQVFEAALGDFAQAVAVNANNNTTRIGRGRALLNLGRFAEAAAAVAAVPTSFTALVHYSATTPAQFNGLWALNDNGRLSVADREGTNGLAFRSSNDPRVPWEDSGGTGFDRQTPLYLQLLSPTKDSPVVLASGIEARLIEAEAALQAGSRITFFSRHNTLRSSIGLGMLLDTGQSMAALVDLHFRERAFWLYSTAHRLGDLRRLVRQYGRVPNTVFPSGMHHKGTPYGNDVNFPIPVQEDNNPNTAPLQQGCLDRNA